MQVSKHIPRAVVAAVAALAVGAPAASAMPIQDGGPSVPANAADNMYASTVEPGFGTSVTGGDLRTEAAKIPVGSPAGDDIGPADLRTEAARSPLESRAGAADVAPADLRTESVKPPVTAPDPVSASDGDDPVDWPLVGLLLAGTIALAGAALAVGRRQAGHAH